MSTDHKRGTTRRLFLQVTPLAIVSTAMPLAFRPSGNAALRVAVDPSVDEHVPSVTGAWAPFRPKENSRFLVVVDPHAYATRNRQFAWELEWRPDAAVLPRTGFELRSMSLNTFYNWTYHVIKVDGGTVTYRRPVGMNHDRLFEIFTAGIADVRSGGGIPVARFSLPYGLLEGEPLRIHIRATPPFESTEFDALTLWAAQPDSPLDVFRGKKASSNFAAMPRAEAILRAEAGPVEMLSVYSHPMPNALGVVRTVLAPRDHYGNAATFDGRLSVTLEWEGKKWKEDLSSSKILKLPAPQGTARLRVLVPVKGLSIDEDITNGSRIGDDIAVTGNPVWTKSPTGLTAAFGEFHWHTEISIDGTGSTENGLLYARDELNMNFATSSDHTPPAERWLFNVAAHDRFNQEDEFVTFYGWEHSTSVGHENYYFLNPNHPVAPTGKAFQTGEIGPKLDELGPVLEKYATDADPFIAIPHHTNAVAETRRRSDDTPFWLPYPWNKPATYHKNVEIFQQRGNQERNEFPSDAWRGWYCNHSSVQDALDHGYQLGFTGGSDNHECLPGRCFQEEGFGRIPTSSVSLTGLWVERLRREDVFRGLQQRHSWAVWDTRALVAFSVNRVWSGDTATIKRGERLMAYIKISAEDGLRTIEIVSSRRVIWSGSSETLDLELEAPLGNAKDSTHFYLRAMQHNGGIIYASPVFLKVV